MTFTIDWQQLAALIIVMTFIGGIGLVILRNSLRGVFVGVDSFEALEMRVAGVESHVKVAPTHVDIAQLANRVGGVEQRMEGVSESLSGLRDGVGRVEHMVDLLLQHQLREGKT
jgi:hypothetical protein